MNSARFNNAQLVTLAAGAAMGISALAIFYVQRSLTKALASLGSDEDNLAGADEGGRMPALEEAS